MERLWKRMIKMWEEPNIKQVMREVKSKEDEWLRKEKLKNFEVDDD